MIPDVIVFVVLLVSAIIAFIRGFIREMLTILGVLGGGGAAYFGGPHLKPFMMNWLGVTPSAAEPERLLGILPYPILADILSYGAIFLAVVIIPSLISHFMAESARAIGLGAMDRTLGFVFGLARGVVVLGLLYLPFHFVLDKETKSLWFSGSRTHIYLENTSQVMASLIPDGTFKRIEETTDQAAKTGARQALEKIDLLRAAPGDVKAKGADDTAPASGPGYAPEERQNMNQIFEQVVPQQTAPQEKQNAPTEKPQP